MTKRDKLPFGPERAATPTAPNATPTPASAESLDSALSPERDHSQKSAPVHTKEEDAEYIPILGKKLSRLDAEIEALRQSPTPTQSQQRTHDEHDSDTQNRTNPFLDGVAFMGIFSRTRDIIAANFTDMLDKADDPQKMIRMIILEM
ncbi:MAG: hypothetical protein ABJK59_12315, partial [Erythrobacter sp.]